MSNFVKLLRNGDIYADKTSAMVALQTKLGSLTDGEICVASYGDSWENAKSLFGVTRYVDGSRSYTIFDVDQTSSDVEKAISALTANVSGSSTDGTVAVNVVEANGKITSVNVTTSNIATKSDVNSLKVTVSSAATPTSGYLKTYEIKQNGNTVGTIDIPKDFLVKSGSVVKGTWGADGKFTPSDTGSDKALALVLNVKDGSAATDETVYINVTDLGKTYSNGNGVAISDTNIISAVKSSSSEKYLTIDGNGISVTGIDAISTAITTEQTRAEKAEKVNADAITAEVNRAKEAEKTLNSTISTVSGDSLTSVASGNGISVTAKASNSQKIGLKLNSTKTDNALTLDSDGLYLSATVDCGTY
jgi:hypothetical protein